MSKLLEYFNAVDMNVAARTAHKTAPIASMNSFGLSVDEQNAILSNDVLGMAAAFGIANVEIPTLHTPNSVFLPTRKTSGKQRFNTLINWS